MIRFATKKFFYVLLEKVLYLCHKYCSTMQNHKIFISCPIESFLVFPLITQKGTRRDSIEK